jgi:hypothetical protein
MPYQTNGVRTDIGTDSFILPKLISLPLPERFKKEILDYDVWVRLRTK